jgi:prolyl-tRNA synthetase
MRLSKLLGKTLRQPPSDARLSSHQLLVRAGYVRSLEGGLFAYLPLGLHALHRLQMLMRRQVVPLGGQEIQIPTMPDADGTSELVRLVRREVDSYRQLPLLVYQATFQPVPQPGTRAGLFGAAERPVVDIHVFGPADLEAARREVEAALEQFLVVCDLTTVWAEAGAGDRRAFFLHPAGDEELVNCSACDYAAERTWAETRWPDPPDEPELARGEIETPGCDTIAALAEFLDIPPSKTLKMVFYSVEGKVTCVVIRGDRSVDEAKLARVLGTDWYYASLEHELAEIGAVGGYASPIGLDRSQVRVVVDPSVRSGKNFVSGANRPDYHFQNVNLPRDFEAGEWADLARIEPGDPCPHCGAALELETAFALVSSTAPMPCKPEAEYLDAEGRGQPLWLAGWQLDLGRVLAAVVEEHQDGYGIIWPIACAPFDVYMVVLDVRREAVANQAGALYERLWADGFSVLLDDRDASAGVKFNDADLIGIPLRLTISKRSAKEGRVEVKWRDASERFQMDEEGLEVELARLREA